MDRAYQIFIDAVGLEEHFSTDFLEEKAMSVISPLTSEIIFKEIHEYTNDGWNHVYDENNNEIPYKYTYAGSFYIRSKLSKKKIDNAIDEKDDILYNPKNGFMLWGNSMELDESDLEDPGFRAMIQNHDVFMKVYNRNHRFV